MMFARFMRSAFGAHVFFLFSLKVELAKLLHLVSTMNLNKAAILLFCQNLATFLP